MRNKELFGQHIQILRSRRRSLAVEIDREGHVIVRAPQRLPQSEIYRFLQEKSQWITKHTEPFRVLPPEPPFTTDELECMRTDAKQDLESRILRYAAVLGVTYGKMSIRFQKTRWGSCSAKGNISLNGLLIALPEDLRDYVVVHELCHRLEMNHSARFKALLGRILPDYCEREQRLKERGRSLLRRLPSHSPEN